MSKYIIRAEYDEELEGVPLDEEALQHMLMPLGLYDIEIEEDEE